jgi:hypothetical protein
MALTKAAAPGLGQDCLQASRLVRQAIHGLVGADLLVQEVAKARPELTRQAYIQRDGGRSDCRNPAELRWPASGRRGFAGL